MSYIVPIGPYHPSLEEPVHARLITEGEYIKDAKIFIGYNHRGIEKLAMERNYIQTTTLVERVCGICSHSHALAFVMACEEIAGVKPPKRSEYINVIISELERIHSHILWVGVALHNIGHDSLFMKSWDDREKIMDMLELLTGNRVNYGMAMFGGVRKDITADKAEQVLKGLEEYEEDLKTLTDFIMNDKTVALRTKGVGVLTTEDALRIGAIGPHARASNVAVDVRKDAPYLVYGDLEFNVCTYHTCDVFSRVVVRLLECFESIKIIRQAFKDMPKGQINLGFKIPVIKPGETMKRHEAPRGQLSYFVVANGTDKPLRVSIHVPTFKNAPTVPAMLRGNTVADAGLIVASIDPCFSCMDR